MGCRPEKNAHLHQLSCQVFVPIIRFLTRLITRDQRIRERQCHPMNMLMPIPQRFSQTIVIAYQEVGLRAALRRVVTLVSLVGVACHRLD